MIILLIIVAMIFGALACFILLCKGRTPCLNIDNEPKIIVDELPAEGIELFNYPAYRDGIEVEYAPEHLWIKYSNDSIAGLVVDEFELMYLIGADAGEKMPFNSMEMSISKAKIVHEFKAHGEKIGLVRAYYDFKSKVLSLDWDIV